MKKKRNLLTIISSILGIFVICGAFCCSLFIGSDKKATESNADSSVLQYWYDEDQENYYSIDLNDLPYDHDNQRSYYEYDEFSPNVYVRCDVLIQYVRKISNNSEVYSLDVYIRYEMEYAYYPYPTFEDEPRYFYSWNYPPVYYPPVSTGNIQSFSLIDSKEVGVLNGSFTVDLDCRGFHKDELNVGGFIGNWYGLEFDIGYTTSNGSFSTDGIFLSSAILPVVYDIDGNIISGVGYGVDNHGFNIFDISMNVMKTDSSFVVLDEEFNIDSMSDYDLGFNSGYSSGFDTGYNNGYSDGVHDGQSIGYNNGYQDGINSQEPLLQNTYSQGYADGYREADNQDEVVTSIFSGIVQVAFVPINFFLSIFNFEILGINISAFIKALFTLLITLYVFRIIFSGGNGGGEQ